MEGTKLITYDALVHAAQVNDAVAQEHDHTTAAGGLRVAADLCVEMDAVVRLGAMYAGTRLRDGPVPHDVAVELVTMAYLLGSLTAFRAAMERD